MSDQPSPAARPEDVDVLCGALPETWFGTSWGDVPTWLVHHRVRDGERQGRGFVLYRKPHRTAIDSATGEPFDDLLVIRTAGEAEKQALVQDETTPFFTIDHFKGYASVLVQLSRLGELTRDELAEVITEAWASQAPRRLVREFLGDA